MFELPECVTLSRQMNLELAGKRVAEGVLGNSPHKFVWYNRSHEEFSRLAKGRRIGETEARGRWLFVAMEPGYVLLLGEFGGRMLYHPPGSPAPAKYHLRLAMDDGSLLTVTTQMWGAMELYEKGRERERQHVSGMRPTPVDEEFTREYFEALIASLLGGEKRSVKALLTQEQLVPGLGNAIAQDIMFRARLHPKHSIGELDSASRRSLYDAVVATVREAIAAGGRNDELDLYGNPGGYVRLMDGKAAGRPCPVCGRAIEKISYLGGACYLCPACQT